LLKPYDGARFQRALDKAYAQRFGTHSADNQRTLVRAMLSDAGNTRLAVKTVEGAWVRLASDEIVRISAANKYACVVTNDARHLVRQPLRELVARLDDRFVRVHRSDIVNVQAVLRLEPWDHGDALLHLRDGSSLVLTRTFRRAFQARFARG
jgi:two-component system LytT family response regulator